VIIGPRAVDCTVGLVRYPGIWPRGMLVSYAYCMSIRQFVSVGKKVGLMGFVFGGPGAFPMSHTIGVSDCVCVLPISVLPFVVRRSDSIYCYL
jgi:hypothetical protein